MATMKWVILETCCEISQSRSSDCVASPTWSLVIASRVFNDLYSQSLKQQLIANAHLH